MQRHEIYERGDKIFSKQRGAAKSQPNRAQKYQSKSLMMWFLSWRPITVVLIDDTWFQKWNPVRYWFRLTHEERCERWKTDVCLTLEGIGEFVILIQFVSIFVIYFDSNVFTLKWSVRQLNANCWHTVETTVVFIFFFCFLSHLCGLEKIEIDFIEKMEKKIHGKMEKNGICWLSDWCEMQTCYNTTNSEQFIFLSLFRSSKSACALRYDAIRYYCLLHLVCIVIVNLLLVCPYFVNVFSF